MKLKLTVSIVVLGCLWLYWQWQTDTKLSHQQSSTPHTISLQKAEKPSTPQAVQQTTAVNQSDAILQEILPMRFSADPYIELSALRQVLWACHKDSDPTELFEIYGEVQQPQLDWHNQLHEACRSHRLQYPSLLTERPDREWLANVAPQTDLGHRIKNKSRLLDSKTRRQENFYLIRAGINTENSALILRYNRMLENILTDPAEYAHEIQSQDWRYTYQVIELATTLIACQFQNGLSCSPESGLMITYCARRPDSCGLDFISWYQKNTLPGMQQDVKLMQQYLMESNS